MNKNQNSNKTSSNRGRTTPTSKGGSAKGQQNTKLGASAIRSQEEDDDLTLNRRNSDRR